MGCTRLMDAHHRGISRLLFRQEDGLVASDQRKHTEENGRATKRLRETGRIDRRKAQLVANGIEAEAPPAIPYSSDP